jgi:hypothetical protein
MGIAAFAAPKLGQKKRVVSDVARTPIAIQSIFPAQIQR